VNRWISRPADGPDRQWHLEAPPTIRQEHATSMTHSACGQRFSGSLANPIERVDSIDEVPEAARCPACQVVQAEKTRQ
jgi:hypothetical protein